MKSKPGLRNASRRIRDCCWQKLSADPTINIDRLQLPESGKPDFFHDHWAHIGEECISGPTKGQMFIRLKDLEYMA